MKLFLSKPLLPIVAAFVFAATVPTNNTHAQTNELVTQLASKVGLSEEKISGGVGALMKYTQESLSPEQFAQISDALPELTGLLDSAPALGEDASTASQLSSLLGDSDTAAKAKRLTELRDSFKQLGIDSEQIKQFVPAIVDYAKANGGDSIAGLLQQVLTAL